MPNGCSEDAGVVDASVGTALPGTFYNSVHFVLPEGTAPGDADPPTFYSGAVDAHFLGAYGVKLQQGRFFDDRDRADTERVAVVDRKFAERFGSGSPIVGRQFRIDPRDPDGTTVTVIGVIAPLTLDAPGNAPAPRCCVRCARIRSRSRRSPCARAAMRSRSRRGSARSCMTVDADAPLYWVRDYAGVIRASTVGERIVAKSFAAFGLIALAARGRGTVRRHGVRGRPAHTRDRRAPRARRADAERARRCVRAQSRRARRRTRDRRRRGHRVRTHADALVANIETVGVAAIVAALGVLVAAVALAVIVPARRALRRRSRRRAEARMNLMENC